MKKENKNKPRRIVFTDLDGTLLDHDTYDFSPAIPGLAALHAAGIPLIFCSSKTRAELEFWSNKLQMRHPMIAENGGVIDIPQGYFSHPIESAQAENDDEILLLGVGYATLRAALLQIAKSVYLPLVGFGDMTIAQVAAKTGLPIAQAARAKIRDADEPFFIDRDYTDQDVQKLQFAIGRMNLRCTQGGRFFHLTGDIDKGLAVRRLLHFFQAEHQETIQTVGLGDSMNDLPLLQQVDVPILVRKKTGAIDQNVLSQVRATCTQNIGPAGWNEAILDLLQGERHQAAGE